MYEEIDMLFHHGYRTRVLMNLIEPNSNVWRARNAKWRDTLEGNSISKNNGGDMTKQKQTEIRQNGNMYGELYSANVEAQLTLLTLNTHTRFHRTPSSVQFHYRGLGVCRNRPGHHRGPWWTGT